MNSSSPQNYERDVHDRARMTANNRAYLARLSPEQRAERNARIRDQLSPELRAERNARRRDQNAQLSPEQRAERNARRRYQNAQERAAETPEQ